MQRLEFNIKKLDYRKWWAELREYFGSQVSSYGWQVTSQSKADARCIREFHRLNKNCPNYRIIFEAQDENQ